MIHLTHKISYTYDRPVFLSPHLIRLAPYAHSHIIPESYSLNLLPAHQIHWQQDVYGNKVARVDFDGKMETMSVEVKLRARLEQYNPFDFLIDPHARQFPFLYPPPIHKALLPYLRISEESRALSEFEASASGFHGEIFQFLVEFNKKVFDQIRCIRRVEEGVQTCEQTLQTCAGSCRDSAWLLVQLLRRLGLASRFVSGYLVQLGTSTGDIADLHAWADVFIPGAGWIGLDTTSGLFTSEGHIALAVGPAPQDVMPVDGTTDRCASTMHYQIAVDRM